MRKFFAFVVFALLVVFSDQSAHAFSDVKKSDYYYEAVQWGQKEKIVSGFSDNTFRPNDKVTQRQFVKMYTNTFDFDQTSLKSENYYAVLEEYGVNFYEGYEKLPMKRGEVAALLAFANGQIKKPYVFNDYALEEVLEPAAAFLLDTGISGGQQSGSTAAIKIGTANELTRAQAITFLYRLQQKNLHTVADSVKRYREPLRFTEQSAVIRTYDFGDDIRYHVLGEGEAFRLAVTYKDYLIGGYESEAGVEVFGSVVGGHVNEQEQPGVNIIYHIDQHEGDYLRAISWWSIAPKFREIVRKAEKLTFTAQEENVTLLYRDLANEFRIKHGVSPLEGHWVLTTAAVDHSQDMAQRNFFSHTNLDGLSPTDRVQRVGTNTEIKSAGENIAAGYLDIFDVHTRWINSGGHRANLLTDYDFIGFGIATSTTSDYELYYTTKFATDYSTRYDNRYDEGYDDYNFDEEDYDGDNQE